MKPFEEDRNPIPIVMLGVHGLWNDTGSSIHMRETAAALVKCGFSPVVVCTASTATPEQADGIRSVVVPVIQIRILRQVSWNLFSLIATMWLVMRYKPIAIYTRLDPGMVSGLVVSALSRRPLVVELNGLPTRDFELYRPHTRMSLALVRWWESAHYAMATLIVGAPGFTRYICDVFKVPREKCVVAPLGVNTLVFNESACGIRRADVIGSQQPIALWVGSVSPWQGLDTLLDAAAILQERRVNVLIQLLGDGPSLPNLRLSAANRGITNIQFVGKKPYREVASYICMARVCICTFPGNRGDPGSISALKTLNYLACSRPVITNVMDEIGPVIVSKNAGLSIQPDDGSSLAAAIEQLVGEPLDTWSERCDAATQVIANGRDWNTISESIAAYIRRIAK